MMNEIDGMENMKPKSCMSDPKAYDRWKTMVPYLYDFFTNHKQMPWPSLSCRWGAVYQRQRLSTKQRIYLSEQTDQTDVNKLIIANADVVKKRIASADSLSSFHESRPSPFIRRHSVIYHPGEVNKIRECVQHPHLVVTHTDSPLTYLWNTRDQPNRSRDKTNKETSKPDLILKGHEDNAEFALSSSTHSPAFASGGKDKLVVLWSIADVVTTLNEAVQKNKDRLSWNSGGSGYESVTSLQPRRRFRGHEDTVEEVGFHPKDPDVIVSVGDDRSIRFWDARVGDEAVITALDAHKSDIQSVDWNKEDVNCILTGAADASIKLFDYRKIQEKGSRSEVAVFKHHTEAILKVEWNPHDKDVFASGAEDGLLNVWDLKKTSSKKKAGIPSELLFQHAGHRAQVVDFQWNPEDPWTILSVSNDQELIEAGHTIQIWRMNDLIYRPQDEVLAELEQYRNKILSKNVAKK